MHNREWKILCQKGAYFLIWEIDNKQDKKTHSALAGGIRYRGYVGERGRMVREGLLNMAFKKKKDLKVKSVWVCERRESRL